MIRPRALALALALGVSWASAAFAQTPRVESYPEFAPRAFVMFSQQQFAAEETFDAVFGDSTGPFRGGGVDVVVWRRLFVELGLARFERSGERVFHFNGETFRLGIPLTVRIRPLELVSGYRLIKWRRIVPYGGLGIASYRYEESSEFAAGGENVSVSGSGLVLVAGGEFRLARWLGVSADVHHSRLREIIGAGGVSKEFGEDDLGGTAARFRIIIGR